MTKTIKSAMIVLILVIFAVLSVMFTGCSENEIEEYKTQISQIQEQNTALQEQNTNLQTKIDFIHTPTDEERNAFYIIKKDVLPLKKSTTEGVSAIAINIVNFVEQFWGVELNKVLNAVYDTDTKLLKNKLQMIVNESSIQINSIVENTSYGQTQKSYIFVTINYDKATNSATEIKVVTYRPEVQSTIYTYTFSTSTLDRQDYLVGSEEFEETEKFALSYDNIQADITVAAIIPLQE